MDANLSRPKQSAKSDMQRQAALLMKNEYECCQESGSACSWPYRSKCQTGWVPDRPTINEPAGLTLWKKSACRAYKVIQQPLITINSASLSPSQHFVFRKGIFWSKICHIRAKLIIIRRLCVYTIRSIRPYKPLVIREYNHVKQDWLSRYIPLTCWWNIDQPIFYDVLEACKPWKHSLCKHENM